MPGERWKRFYEERDYDRCAYLEGTDMARYADTFFGEVGIPQSVASIGCGPAVTEFELADRFPDTTFACYDIAREVIEDNRTIADNHGLDNISFAVASLPELELDRRFEIVYCVATLYFVEDVRTALGSLYKHVEEGGHLIVSYPTAELQEWVREQNEEKRAFFELVEDGQNVTTADEIETVLDAPVESYWSAVTADVDRSGTAWIRK
jgi:trans-aconitate methyltransferase